MMIGGPLTEGQGCEKKKEKNQQLVWRWQKDIIVIHKWKSPQAR